MIAVRVVEPTAVRFPLLQARLMAKIPLLMGEETPLLSIHRGCPKQTEEETPWEVSPLRTVQVQGVVLQSMLAQLVDPNVPLKAWLLSMLLLKEQSPVVAVVVGVVPIWLGDVV